MKGFFEMSEQSGVTMIGANCELFVIYCTYNVSDAVMERVEMETFFCFCFFLGGREGLNRELNS